MPITSGKGRVINGSGADRVKRNNLTEFRGSFWEAVNDWFFGINQIDYDWRNTADAAKVEKWTFTQVTDYVQTASIDVESREFIVDAESAGAPDESASNQRDIMTIPETGTWGVSHAQTSIAPRFMNFDLAVDLDVKPQHGIGLRAQEDNGKRRMIIAWHDVTFANPQAINLGVWVANVDGTNFQNRQTNVTMVLNESQTVTAAVRSGNKTKLTFASHAFKVGDRVDVNVGADWNTSSMSRVTNVVTATSDIPHGLAIGGVITNVFSSIASFDGTHTITDVPSSTTYKFTDAGADEGPATALTFDKTDYRAMAPVTDLTATTITIDDTGPDKTFLLETTSKATRLFPYFMEMRVIGNVAQVRCWGRHQAVPDWFSQTNALVGVMDAPQKNFTISLRARASNVATLTIGAHHIVPGERVTISGVTGDTSFHATAIVVQSITDTTVSYLNTGSDVSPVASVGTCNRLGTGTLANQNLIPMPIGSGRIAFESGHVGDLDLAKARYGWFYGDNNAYTDIVSIADTAVDGYATELELTPQATFAGLATATGQAFDATVSVSGDTFAQAVTATGTGQAFDATTTLAANALAGNASATGQAFDPTLTLAANAPASAATATGQAFDLTLTLAANATAGVATGTGTAFEPTLTLAANALADVATGSGQAFEATISTAGQTNAPAGLASTTGQAFDASTQLSSNALADIATATGQAFDASPVGAVNAPAVTVTATGTAFNATISTATVPWQPTLPLTTVLDHRTLTAIPDEHTLVAITED